MRETLYEEMFRAEEKHWWFLGRRRIVRSLVERYAPRAGRLRICELGCGSGANIASWADAHDVAGMECNRTALAYAQTRIGDRAVYGMLPDEAPFPPSSFDVIIMTDVLEHIEDDVAALQAAGSLLAPGGILVATVPAHAWLYGPRDREHFHFRRYSAAGFKKLFADAGFQIEVFSPLNFWLFGPAAVVRLWQRWRDKVPPAGDLRTLPGPINAGLARLFASEGRWIPRPGLPFGLSLVTVARRRPLTSAPDQ